MHDPTHNARGTSGVPSGFTLGPHSALHSPEYKIEADTADTHKEDGGKHHHLKGPNALTTTTPAVVTTTTPVGKHTVLSKPTPDNVHAAGSTGVGSVHPTHTKVVKRGQK